MATALALSSTYAFHWYFHSSHHIHFMFDSFHELTKLAYSQCMGLHTVPQLVEHCSAKKEQGLNPIGTNTKLRLH